MIVQQAFRALLLDRIAYDGVSDEPQPIIGAMAVVGVVAISLGLGVMNESLGGEKVPPGLVVSLTISTVLVGWGLWSASAWFVGTRVLGGGATYRTMLRAIGIAYAPGVFMVLFAVPSVGPIIFLTVRLWMLAAATVAVREAQSTGWGRAFSAALVGWWLSQFLFPALMLPLGGDEAIDGVPAAAEQSLDVGGHGLLDLFHGLAL
ncbi:MAG: YIP1 family protein [Chloroflexi bacterium]|nr:YIP1 family protein [Chloroflexota bacterium]